MALLAVRHRGRATSVLERSTYLVLAMPGLVIALALSYFAERYADGFLYQSPPLLIVAYAIMFFPLALVGGAGVGGPGARSASKTSPARSGRRGSRCSGG